MTCWVDEYGNIRQTLLGADGTTFAQGILSGVVQVPQTAWTTFYTQHGEVFSVACLGLAAFFAGARNFRKREVA